MKKNDIVYKAFSFLMYLMRFFPIQKKVFGRGIKGRYSDNTMLIFEELKKDSSIKLVWDKSENPDQSLIEGVKLVSFRNMLRMAYELTTSRVLITMTAMPLPFRKRKGQVILNTWHGGLGIKKVASDEGGQSSHAKLKVAMTNQITDVFISNSNHLSKVYRNSFGYKGPIWKCGYPKNDQLLDSKEVYKKRICKYYNVSEDVRFFLYAPTFRTIEEQYVKDVSCYKIDFDAIKKALEERFGGVWQILVRYHPNLSKDELEVPNMPFIKNVTSYSDMQDLIIASEALASDYSSCIFDGAIAGLKCFLYATDYTDYKQLRGVYYDLETLPFPFAENNSQLIANIITYNESQWKNQWDMFADKMGLIVSGHATIDICNKIKDVLNNKQTKWQNTDI